MEKTIKNMTLTLDNAEFEFRNLHYNAIKTLMNTYCNLLKQLTTDLKSSNYENSHNEILKAHRDRVKNLHSNISKAIHFELDNGNYKSANNLTMITERLQRSKNDLNHIIVSVEVREVSPQHKDK